MSSISLLCLYASTDAWWVRDIHFKNAFSELTLMAAKDNLKAMWEKKSKHTYLALFSLHTYVSLFLGSNFSSSSSSFRFSSDKLLWRKMHTSDMVSTQAKKHRYSTQELAVSWQILCSLSKGLSVGKDLLVIKLMDGHVGL